MVEVERICIHTSRLNLWSNFVLIMDVLVVQKTHFDVGVYFHLYNLIFKPNWVILCLGSALLG